jgi:hypothetical protein
VVVTRKTGLEELLERFVTREQARFYLEHSGVPFEPYEEEQRAHDEALTGLKAALPGGVRSQFVERSFLPTFAFGERGSSGAGDAQGQPLLRAELDQPLDTYDHQVREPVLPAE